MLLFAAVTPATAQRFPQSQWAPQQDEARRIPFAQIERDLRGRFGGELIDVNDGRDVYIVSWITGDGRRIVVEVDARTGRILSTRG